MTTSVRSPFSPEKQSHVTKIVDVCHRSQLPRFSLNSQSTCFVRCRRTHIAKSILITLRQLRSISLAANLHLLSFTPVTFSISHEYSPPANPLLGGVYMRKLAPARVSNWDDFLISYRVYMMTGLFHILLFNGTFHVDKIHVWFKIANITHALPVPVYRQTDFTPKWVVVSRLHDTVARFRTGVKFSPRCENRGELTPG